MRRRQFLGLTAQAAGVTAGLATGCGLRGSDSTATLRLVAAEYGNASGTGSTERYWREVVAAFRRDHPGIRVRVDVVQWQDANIRVAQMVQAGEAPDIAQISAFANFAAAEELYPASDLLSIPVLSDFVPSLAAAGEVEDVQYAMPFASRTWRLFCNSELFEQAGLDPTKPPRTWDELQEAAGTLSDAAVRVPFGLALGHEEAHTEAMAWMLGGGSGITDSVGSYTIDDDRNVATFRWLRDNLVLTGLTGGSQPVALDRAHLYREFTEGRVAMVFGDSLLLREAERGPVRFVTAPLPGRTKPVSSTVGDATWLLAFTHRGNREPIATFLDYVYTTDRLTAFARQYEHATLPVTTSALERRSDTEVEKSLRPFQKDLPGATFPPVGKASWATVAALVNERIGQAMQPDADVPAILAGLQREAEAAEEETA